MSGNGSNDGRTAAQGGGGAATIDPQRPIDSLLAQAIGEHAQADRGFALSVAQSLGDGAKAVVFEVQPKLPPVDMYEPPTNWRAHEIDDVASLVTFARKYGTQDRSLVLYDNSGAQLSIDEEAKTGSREIVRMAFRYSQDRQRLLELVRPQGWQHRDLLRYLLANQHLLREPSIIDSMRKVSVRATVKQDSDLRIEGEDTGVVFSTAAGDELIKFPRVLNLQVPVLEEDVPDAACGRIGKVFDIEARVEITLPQKADQPIVFGIFAASIAGVQLARVDEALAVLRAELDGWTVVRGRHRELERVVGRHE